MIHGYCRTSNDGRIWLGFTDCAPIFKQLADDKPTQKLVEAKDGDEVVGHSVVRNGEDHGFLFYPKDKKFAEDEASHFTELFGRRYDCLSLRIQHD